MASIQFYFPLTIMVLSPDYAYKHSGGAHTVQSTHTPTLRSSSERKVAFPHYYPKLYDKNGLSVASIAQVHHVALCVTHRLSEKAKVSMS